MGYEPGTTGNGGESVKFVFRLSVLLVPKKTLSLWCVIVYNLKIIIMRVISSSELRNNMEKYLDLAADEKIVIHVGKLDYPVYFESYWWNGESDVTYGEIENGLKLRAVSEEEQTFLEQGRMEFSENNPECSFPLKSISSGKDEIMVKGFFEFADGYDPEKVRVSVEFSEGLEASCHLVATSPNNQGVYNRGGSFSIDMRRDERPVEAFVSIKGIHTVADPVMTVRVEDISR